MSFEPKDCYHKRMYRIACVEDSPKEFELLSQSIERFQSENNNDLRVTHFSNAERFLESFACQYDIIFLDHTMPIIDGLNILTIMRTLDDHPNKHTPIIMLTADDNASAKTICETMGFADFLTKPVHEDALFTILLKYLPKELVNHFDELPQKEEAAIPAPEVKQEKKIVTEPQNKKTTEYLPDDLLNVSVGLFCCEKNEALYRKKIMLYVEKQFDDILGKLFKEEDFESYRLMVQTLKSASLNIGAVNIASIAKLMEFACSEGDYDYVRVRHEDLMSEYKKLVRELKERMSHGRAN